MADAGEEVPEKPGLLASDLRQQVALEWDMPVEDIDDMVRQNGRDFKFLYRNPEEQQAYADKVNSQKPHPLLAPDKAMPHGTGPGQSGTPFGTMTTIPKPINEMLWPKGPMVDSQGKLNPKMFPPQKPPPPSPWQYASGLGTLGAGAGGALGLGINWYRRNKAIEELMEEGYTREQAEERAPSRMKGMIGGGLLGALAGGALGYYGGDRLNAYDAVTPPAPTGPIGQGTVLKT